MDEREELRYRSKRVQEHRLQDEEARGLHRKEQHIREIPLEKTVGREERRRDRRAHRGKHKRTKRKLFGA